MKNYLALSALAVFCLISVAVSAEEHQHGSDKEITAVLTQQPDPDSVNEVKNASIVFLLTTDDPIRATHALHMAETTHGEGHPTAIILLTEGARLASKDLPQPVSPLTETSLQETIKELIEKGISIGVAPPSMQYLGMSEESLIDGVTMCNKDTVMARLFAKDGKIITW